MFRPLAFPKQIEPLVRLIEDTQQSKFLGRLCECIRYGVSHTDILLASTLAVIRSSDNPRGHHGGPVHLLTAVHAVHEIASRLPSDQAPLPVIQHAVLANKNIQNCSHGPFTLAESSRLLIDDSAEQTLALFNKYAKKGSTYPCERLFRGLVSKLGTDATLEHLVKIAIPKNPLDDHYILLTAFGWRAIDVLGEEFAEYLIRPVVRYVTGGLTPPFPTEIMELMNKHVSEPRDQRIETREDETRIISELSQQLGNIDSFSMVPRLLSQSIADGLSLRGAGEALSIAASMLFLRWQTLNSMDVHQNITANALRHVIGLEQISWQTKLHSLFVWHAGPDVRRSRSRLISFAETTRQAGEKDDQMENDLLGRIDQLLEIVTSTDTSTPDDADSLQGIVDETVSLAFRYAHGNPDPAALFQVLARHVCRDQWSEMHTYEHHQVMYEEYYNTRPQLRAIHLVAAVKGVAISLGRSHEVYRMASGDPSPYNPKAFSLKPDLKRLRFKLWGRI